MKPTVIHVNRQNIAMNAKDEKERPFYTVKLSNGSTRYAKSVEIRGPSRLVNGRLSCGARAWMETHSPITMHDECSFTESRIV